MIDAIKLIDGTGILSGTKYLPIKVLSFSVIDDRVELHWNTNDGLKEIGAHTIIQVGETYLTTMAVPSITESSDPEQFSVPVQIHPSMAAAIAHWLKVNSQHPQIEAFRAALPAFC